MKPELLNQQFHHGILFCPGCNEPIIGGSSVWKHQRLNCYIHANPECLIDVHGEDISQHSMIRANISYS
jgi:hypothetical protein